MNECKGMNCGATDGVSHSPECHAEHAATVAGGVFTKSTAQPEPAAPAEQDWSEPELWAEIYRLRAAVKGPDGFDSWQDAATDERIRRVRAERALAAPSVAPEPVAWMWRNKITGAKGVYFEDPERFFNIADKGEYEWTQLFTHPPRAPLTDAKWCADWLRNNYQHHLNIASLCEHMIEDAERAHGISAAAIGADGGRGKA